MWPGRDDHVVSFEHPLGLLWVVRYDRELDEIVYDARQMDRAEIDWAKVGTALARHWAG